MKPLRVIAVNPYVRLVVAGCTSDVVSAKVMKIRE